VTIRALDDLPELKATRVEVDGHVATVWLHRPHRHNAWTGRMDAEYRMLLARLDADPSIRAVVVTGTPPAFCVGADKDALAGHVERGGYDPGLPVDAAQPGHGVRPTSEAPLAWHHGLRVPVIAAVNGACAGVGFALALWCDLRVVSATAKLTTAAPKLGLPAEFGASWILPRLIGVTRAADLLLSGRVVTGAETDGWGLWNHVMPSGEDTLATALTMARQLATEASPAAVAMTKRQLYDDLVHQDPAASVRESLRLLDEAMRSDDYREGVAALRDRRPPKF
jgi:enoyl-CoA hydratase/carnithine racemase